MSLALGGSNIYSTNLNSGAVNRSYFGVVVVHGKLPEEPVSGLTPIMANFRVENDTPTLVHFDSTGDITGLTTSGFIISNKAINSVTIDGDGLGGYFTVSVGFTFWDNNTIRLESGDGIVDDFTLSYIINNITEPTTSNPDMFVADNGTGTGTSTGDPMSITAAQTVPEGTTVYIKAGNYSGEFKPTQNGTTDNPIKFIGYTNTPGDITDHIADTFSYADIDTVIDSSKFPVFTGTHADSNGIFETQDYHIYKNIQAHQYYYNFLLNSGSNLHVENCTAKDGYATVDTNNGFGFYVGNEINTRVRIKKNVSVNNNAQNFYCRGDHHLFEGNKSMCNADGVNGYRPTDYYMSTYDGSFNIYRNNYIQRGITGGTDLTHGGHGIGFKDANNLGNTYNLVEKNNVVGIRGEIYYAAHRTTAYNVFKDNETTGWATGDCAAFSVRNGANNNIYERNISYQNKYGIYMWANTEDQENATGYAALNNLFRNNIFDGVSSGVTNSNSVGNPTYGISGNKIYNNTFTGTKVTAQGFFWSTATTGHDLTYTGNEFKNNIIEDMSMVLYKDYASSGDYFKENNFWFNNTFTDPTGDGNVTVDTGLNGSYVPQTAYASIQVSPLSEAEYGYYGNERNNIVTTVGSVLHADEVIETPVITETPILSDFRVEDTNLDRVLFDASADISTLTSTGFVISGKTLSAGSELTIDGDGLGGYFTVSSTFNYWDNNTIRLESGDGTVYDFTMEYITNNILEPTISASNYRYVSTTGNDSNDGTTELLAKATLKNAIQSLPSGGGYKIWVKAGTYNNENITAADTYNGSESAPYIVEGYKTTIGDITSNYYNYDIVTQVAPALDPEEMPVFDGGDRTTGIFVYNDQDPYWIWKNIQITGYTEALRSRWSNVQGQQAIRVNIKDIGSTAANQNVGYGIYWVNDTMTANRNRVVECNIVDVTAVGIGFQGQDNLAIDTKVIATTSNGSDAEDTDVVDYYYKSESINNIFIRCQAIKNTPSGAGHNGHGFALKTANSTYPVTHNLVDDCLAIGILGSFQARHAGCQFNVFKNSEAHADIANRRIGSGNYTAGIEFLSGGSDNIFENLYIHDVDAGVRWNLNGESDQNDDIQQDAIIKNCIIKDVKNVMTANSIIAVTSTPTGNKLLNCTIIGAENFYWQWNSGGTISFGINQIENCIIENVPTLNKDEVVVGWTYSYDFSWDIWLDNGTPITGTDNESMDTLLDANYRPQATFTDIDVPKISGVNYDKASDERQDPTTVGSVLSAEE